MSCLVKKIEFTMLQFLSLTKLVDFHQTSITHDNIIIIEIWHAKHTKSGRTKVSWDDSICKLIHTKCHYKRYHNNIKYHVTLNTIFSVVIIYVHRQNPWFTGYNQLQIHIGSFQSHGHTSIEKQSILCEGNSYQFMKINSIIDILKE